MGLSSIRPAARAHQLSFIPPESAGVSECKVEVLTKRPIGICVSAPRVKGRMLSSQSLARPMFSTLKPLLLSGGCD